MADITLTTQQYESLVALARKGAELEGTIRMYEKDPTLRPLWEKARTQYGYDPNLVRNLEQFLRTIEKANNIQRYFLAIRWTEANQPLPPRVASAPTRFPENWPPQLEGTIEFTTRPIARSDVDAFLSSQALKPLSVMVTSDPGKRVGWTELDVYFR